jgi:hypothetical protein
VLPCVRSTTGRRVSQHLTIKEMSNALDLPATLVQGLPDVEVRSILRPGLGPSKIRSHVAGCGFGGHPRLPSPMRHSSNSATHATHALLADVMFLVPLSNSLWPPCMHESLTIAFVAPLLVRVPWSIRSTKLAGDLEKDMLGGHFGTKRLHWDPCQEAWHGSCYRQKGSRSVPNSEHKGS